MHGSAFTQGIGKGLTLIDNPHRHEVKFEEGMRILTKCNTQKHRHSTLEARALRLPSAMQTWQQ